ncbi:MAG: secondary thiamine-phosphate synthase enzyme YjbQ [Planctomycetota bacterium]|jgi:secondary thiamine-phosphate synthase enzyme
MKIVEETFNVKTHRHCEMINITSQVQAVVSDSGLDAGMAIVSCPHTTAAITINENADPDVMHDVLLTLEELVPTHRKGYRHCEGNSDAHVKSSLFGCSEIVTFSNSFLQLGTWQGIFFCEFDGPRNRKVHIRIMG